MKREEREEDKARFGSIGPHREKKREEDAEYLVFFGKIKRGKMLRVSLKPTRK